MLQNRVYRGEIVHKEQSYPGEHMPIIDKPPHPDGLRNFAAYAAALAGYTTAIIDGDLLGATGGVNGETFLLAVIRASEIRRGRDRLHVRCARSTWIGRRGASTTPALDERDEGGRAYEPVARRRYRWFGRRENCVVVPPSESHRFIGVRRQGSGSA